MRTESTQTDAEVLSDEAALDQPITTQHQSPIVRLFPALSEPRFRLLWITMLPATFAVQMAAVTIGYAAFDLSGSATVLGGVSLATGLPMMLLSLVGGVVADRWPRRLVLLGTQATLGLGAAAIAGLALTNHLAVWHLYALGAVQGTAFAFNMPARQAFIAELVPPRLLNSAVALNNSGMNFARIAGPSLAGGLLTVPFVGVGGVFASIAAMYGAVLVALFHLPERGTSAHGRGRRGWEQAVDGLRHIRSNPQLVGLLTLGFIPLLFGMPFQNLLPLFAERVHGAGALGLGIMTAAVGAGALVGSVVVVVLARSQGLGLIQAVLGVTFGAALIGFALAPSFGLALVGLVVAGFSYAGYLATNETLIMAHTDHQFYGRVMSVYLLSFGFMPVASFPEAIVADHIGGPATIAGVGVIVAASVLLAQLVPSYRRLG